MDFYHFLPPKIKLLKTYNAIYIILFHEPNINTVFIRFLRKNKSGKKWKTIYLSTILHLPYLHTFVK